MVLGLVVAACGGPDSLFSPESAAAPADHRYVIDPGTGARIDAGEQVDILPATLEVHVGEVIEIVNLDDRGHLVGPFYAGAGETVRQRFASEGTFIGECTAHPSGMIEITILPS